ncbi:UDP-N-acetylmuramate--L-alanine ligase [Xanthovirga aplysinae]|uniref:UDP-N-acetylmuramate--L-alanine ligase n=1 Tax=Xanthovirga aplysinae TaxID=2529853 RepID=UPI0012BD4D07|nr:UDP-N-acetylmuramate--L-alanine ligase [Xanthovirga aplysinae]MTI32857.1 UDP-N-acetylmuramate--L-alanine ligase [Xanthovirga aplysinae]
MSIKDIHTVYFLGIGGIGMSALARWFKHNAFQVEGYDRTSTPLTDELENEGIRIHFNDEVSAISQEVLKNKAGTLVVYTPAIPKEHKIYNYLKSGEYTLMKRSQLLGLVTDEMFTVAVAGTHGKTTTSSMIAHILKASSLNCTAFLGGIATNYNSNLILNEEGGTNLVAVVEADEFDRSFLTLHPNIAVVTSADADHLDIYSDESDLQNSFRDFISQVRKSGHLFIEDAVANTLFKETIFFDSLKDVSVSRYSLEKGDFVAKNLRVEEGSFVFDFQGPQNYIEALKLFVPGFHNVENAIAAIAVALQLGIKEQKIKEAIASFRGVKRRFEYVLRSPQLVYIDDYAHHPTEIDAFLRSVKALYPGKKVTVIFQPHLYSRTRDFVEGFAKSLNLADEVWLLDIYPAREKPIEGVSSQLIFDKLHSVEKRMCKFEDFHQLLKKGHTEVLVTIGAGDIGQMVEPIKNMLLNSDNK